MGTTRDKSTYSIVVRAGPILYHPTNFIVSELVFPDRIEAQNEAENAGGWHIIDLTDRWKKRYLEDHPNVGLWDPFQMAFLWLINGGY